MKEYPYLIGITEHIKPGLGGWRNAYNRVARFAIIDSIGFNDASLSIPILDAWTIFSGQLTYSRMGQHWVVEDHLFFSQHTKIFYTTKIKVEVKL